MHWLVQARPNLDPASAHLATFVGRGSAGRHSKRKIVCRDFTRAGKPIAANAAFEAATLAAHVLRGGFATSAINRGVRDSVVREHASGNTDSVLGRCSRVDKSRDNAVSDLFENETDTGNEL